MSHLNTMKENPEMRRTASEVIRGLEKRVSRLERQASRSDIPTIQEVFDFLKRSKTSVGGKVTKSSTSEDRIDAYLFLSVEKKVSRIEFEHMGRGMDWDYDYSRDLGREVKKLLTDKFPALLEMDNRVIPKWSVHVSTSGYLRIMLSKRVFPMT